MADLDMARITQREWEAVAKPAARKRKRTMPSAYVGSSTSVSKGPRKLAAGLRETTCIDLTGSAHDDSTPTYTSKGASHHEQPKSPKKRKAEQEKRCKRYRARPPQSFTEYYQRAMTQRMFVIHRSRGPADNCIHHDPATSSCQAETVELAGSTGNIYSVSISHVPTCTCPNFAKGNPQCKHIVYVVVKVLKAPLDLQYQLAFLSDELRRIFDAAGPLPDETVRSKDDMDGKRHAVEGDCAICCEDLVADGREAIVWCRAACGNNLHKTCFDQWAATKRGGQVTCPYCRMPWQGDKNDLRTASATGKVGADGYVNIAAQLGISGRRDYNSYHSYWVERQVRNGYIAADDFDDEY